MIFLAALVSHGNILMSLCDNHSSLRISAMLSYSSLSYLYSSVSCHLFLNGDCCMKSNNKKDLCMKPCAKVSLQLIMKLNKTLKIKVIVLSNKIFVVIQAFVRTA